MNRRRFMTFLAGLPFVGQLVQKAETKPWRRPTQEECQHKYAIQYWRRLADGIREDGWLCEECLKRTAYIYTVQKDAELKAHLEASMRFCDYIKSTMPTREWFSLNDERKIT